MVMTEVGKLTWCDSQSYLEAGRMNIYLKWAVRLSGCGVQNGWLCVRG